MALITFPSSVLITRSDLSLAHPGQVVLRSIYGAGTQVLGRGPGHWTGRLEIAETDRATDEQRRQVETFLTALRGLENTFEVPIQRPSSGSLATETTLTVTAAAEVASGVKVTVGVASGLLAGDYVRIGARLYQLTSDQAASKFIAQPPVLPAVSDDVIWENVTCLARLASERGVVASLTPEFGGPWTIEWEEAI